MTTEQADSKSDAQFMTRLTVGLTGEQAAIGNQVVAKQVNDRADSTKRNQKSAWSGKDGWLTFCAEYDVKPVRAHEGGPTPELIKFDSNLFVWFALWKIGKMQGPKGKGRGQEINTVFQNISSIKGYTKENWGLEVELDQNWLNSQRNGWKVERVKTQGPAPRFRKLAIVANHMIRMKRTPIDWARDWPHTFFTMCQAAIENGWRLGDMTSNKAFNPNINYTLSDLKWFDEHNNPTNPEVFSQRSLRHGEWCTLPANPSKCDRTLEKYAELKFPMVYDSSNSVINAARDLADMERRRNCFNVEERAQVPLFLDPKSKKAVTSSNFCKMLKTVLTLAFGEDEAKKYGSHSFRIGGATILKMLGHSDEFIMAWGRWSSDAYRRYVRQSLTTLKIMAQAFRYEKTVDELPMEQVTNMTRSLPPLSRAQAARTGLRAQEVQRCIEAGVEFDMEAGKDPFGDSEDEESLPDYDETYQAELLL